MEYKIVTSDRLYALDDEPMLESRTLENRVMRAIKDGWELVGSPYCFMQEDRTIHAQAMTKN